MSVFGPLRDRLRPMTPGLQPGSVGRRLMAGSAWALVGSAAAQGSSLLTAIVVARLLGARGYGEFAMVVATVGSLGVFAGLGLGITATKFIAELRDSDPDRAARIAALVDRAVLVSGVLVSTALFLLAPVIAKYALNNQDLTMQLRLGSLLLFLNEVGSVQLAALAGYEAFRAIARVNLARGIVALPCVSVCTLLFGLSGAVVATTGVALLNVVLGRRAVMQQRRRHPTSSQHPDWRSERRVLFTFAFPAFLAMFVVSPASWVGSAILANQPGGYAQLGVVNAARQWQTVAQFLPTSTGQVALPLLASGTRVSKPQDVRKVLLPTILVSGLAALGVAVPVLLLRDAVAHLYGSSFGGFGNVLAVTALTMVIMAVQTPVGQLVAATERMWLGAAMNLAWAVIFVGTAFVAIQSGWGALGLAVAYLIAYSCHGLWTFAFARAHGLRFSE